MVADNLPESIRIIIPRPIVVLHIAYEIIVIKFQKFTMNIQEIV